MTCGVKIITVLTLIIGLYSPPTESADPKSSARLREIVLKQPDFKAKLHYYRDDYPGVGIESWTEVVYKKGKMFRFEGIERNRSSTRRLIILGYPAKDLTVIFPDESHYNAISQNDLDQACFTTLSGMDVYYVTKLALNRHTRFEYVSTTDYNGCSCSKIRVTNQILLDEITDLSKEEIGHESLYLTFGPLYLYSCPKLGNLIVGVTVEGEGTEKEIYSLSDVSLDSSHIPSSLFQVSPAFRKSE